MSLTGFMQDSAEHEFPFLQEVYTPGDAHKVEYDGFSILWVIYMLL